MQLIGRGGDDPLRSGFVTSDKPFYFSVAVPEGNYKVTATLGDPEGESTTTIKAELRRLMLEHVHTKNEEFAVRSFIVNVARRRLKAMVPCGSKIARRPPSSGTGMKN